MVEHQVGLPDAGDQLGLAEHLGVLARRGLRDPCPASQLGGAAAAGGQGDAVQDLGSGSPQQCCQGVCGAGVRGRRWGAG